MVKKALNGVKVADFCWLAAGPISTSWLGRFGAEVVKIESHKRVDVDRTTPPFAQGTAWLGDRSGLFANSGGTGRYSITLNLSHRKGKEVARRLVAWADIVSENFTTGTMAKWGLAYENLKKIKPDIIMLSLSMYGQSGPYAAQPGHGGTLVANSGMQHLTGAPDGLPMSPAGAYSDMVVPRFAVLSVVAALDYRARTGIGQHLDLSQQDCMLQKISPALLEYEVNGRELQRLGNRSTYAAPHGVYRCKGEFRWCAITVFNDADWQNFCEVIGQPSWKTDPEFATLLQRLKNVEKLDKRIEEWTLNHTPEEVVSLMQSGGVAAGLVQNGRDLLDDPQLKSRGYYREFDHPAMGKFAYSGLPVKMSKTPYETRRSPCMGEDNEYVYTKLLGMKDEEFIRLLGEGVFE